MSSSHPTKHRRTRLIEALAAALALVFTPTYDRIHPGPGIPLKWTLNSDYGLDILAAGSPSVQQVDCSTGAPMKDGTHHPALFTFM